MCKILGTKECDDLDRLIKEFVTSRNLPFVIVALANKEGIVYQNAVKHQEYSDSIEMNSIFWYASMTKIVTSVAVMQQIEEKKINLDQDVKEYIPEIYENGVMVGYDNYGCPKHEPVRGKISIRNLLTHTSGLAFSFWNSTIHHYHHVKDIPDTLSGKKESIYVPLVREPGVCWEYGISTAWLGILLERVVGQTLGAYFQERIFEPLGMTSTGFRVKNLDMLTHILVRCDGGKLERTDFIFPQEAEFQSGDAGLYGTIPDYIKLTRMLLNKGVLDGKKILKSESVRLMFQNQIGELSLNCLKGCGKAIDLNLYPDTEKKWGLGFMINAQQLSTGRSEGSAFWGGAANSFFWIDPKKSITGVFATQVLPFLDNEAFSSFDDFERMVYNCLF